MTARQKVYRLFDAKRDWFDYIVVGVVAVNLLFMILETVASLKVTYGFLFDFVEVGTVILFTLEYLLEIWSVVENPKYAHPVWGRLKWATTFMGLVDLCSFLFFWLRFVGLAWSSLQLFSALRVIKVAQYMDSFQTIGKVLRNKRNELLGGMSIVLFVLVLFSVLVYNLEHATQPDKFDNLPDTLYWGVITMTSVGYGDMSPVTSAGKLFGAALAVLGVMSFAIPVGIIAGGFMDLEKEKNTQ